MLYNSACVDRAGSAYHVPVSHIELVISSPHGADAIGVMGIPPAWIPVLARYGFNPTKISLNACDNIAAGTWILAVSANGADDGALALEQPSADVPACAVQAARAYHVSVAKVEQILSSSHPASGIGPMGIPSAWLSLLTEYGFNSYSVEHDSCMGMAAGIWILGVEAMQRGSDVYSGYAGAITSSYSPPAWLLPIIARASVRYDLPAPLILAVAAQESGFKPGVTSSAGAEGVMQLMPKTAASYNVADPFDPTESVMGGAAYLADLRVQFDGSVPLMLAAYNAGSQAVIDSGDKIPPYQETERYVPQVIDRYRIYSAAAGAQAPRTTAQNIVAMNLPDVGGQK